MKETVYFSKWSKIDFPKLYNEFINHLERFNIPHGIIEGTNDYFCRDYMSIQNVNNDLIQFRFEPDYLMTPEKKKYITDTENVLLKNSFLSALNCTNSNLVLTNSNLKLTNSNLKLDGGNVIQNQNSLIVTDKILKDNQQLTKDAIINELCSYFHKKIIIVPAYPGEETGHADGLVRFIDEQTVLTWNLAAENTVAGIQWSQTFHKVLAENGLKLIYLPSVLSNVDLDNWRYLNYLELDKLLIIPRFNIPSDKIMLDFFKTHFKIPVVTVDATAIIKHGGVLNCMTWNIQS